MNSINTIYTTISNGQTHIAADDQYIGSVDSYNNCFTQFFAWIFRFSMTVNFDGKIRSVNKESYRELVLSLQKENIKVQEVSTPHFRNLIENVPLPSNHRKMRDVISQSDSIALFHKLAYAISKGNQQKALLLIGKGASLDSSYYERTNLPPSFYSDDSGLYREKSYNFKVIHATPILQAAIKGNNLIVERLKNAGASLDIAGKQYTFSRTITDVHRSLELAPVLHHHRHRHHNHLHWQPQIRERVTIQTQDSRTPEQKITLQEL